MLTSTRLKEMLRYVKSTGVFYWKKSPKPGVNAGDVAGCLISKGYILIGLDGVLYRAHRLAWFYVKGSWPADQVDHRNTVKCDNRWSNLRAATNRFNQQNQVKAPRSNKSSGLLGVTWSKLAQMWQSQIKHFGKNYFLGMYFDPLKAHRAYVKAKRRLHAGCTI